MGYKNGDRRNYGKKFGKDKKSFRKDKYTEHNIKDLEEKKKRPKIPNEEAIQRSIIHGRQLNKMEFVSPTGRSCLVKDGMLTYFTLTPSRPLLICQYVITDMTEGFPGERRDRCNMRHCTLGRGPADIKERKLEICHITDEKINAGRCFAKRSKMSAIDFWVVTNGSMTIDGVTREFPVAFFNKLRNDFIGSVVSSDNPNINKVGILRSVYDAARTGRINTPILPKPGNDGLFHTLFSGNVECEIETFGREILKGTVEGYHNPTGGIPSLFLWENIDGGRKLSETILDTISMIIVNKYEMKERTRRWAMEMILKGHIIIVHPVGSKVEPNTIFDYCKSNKLGRQQIIHNDGKIELEDKFDEHDKELRNIIETVN